MRHLGAHLIDRLHLRHGSRGRLRVLAAAAVIAAFAGAGVTTLLRGGSARTSPSTTAALASDTSSVAAAVEPGLVAINTTTSQGKAAGTGMVVSSTGEVVTNNHVISGATKITATDIGNGRTYTAKVVGYDRSADVAVIQLVGASGLTTVTLGDSSTVKAGLTVLTIGNAGGTGTMSVATGTVTALNRSITASDEGANTERLHGMIEIAGSLQAGDSGGPMVDGSGRVVGMDTAASASYQFTTGSGQDFAIPINTVMTIAKAIESGDATSSIHLGATAEIGVAVSTRPAFVGYGDSTGVRGAFVIGVAGNTPAARAGLRPGDTITGLGGKRVTSTNSLSKIKDGYHPGDRVSIRWVDSSGTSHTAKITLAKGAAA